MNATDYVIVLTTLPADTDASQFATALIEERLAACVSVMAEMQSFYRWENRIDQERERQILIKTTAAQVAQLWDRVRTLHPLEVPEFLVLPVVDGSDAYLNWVRASTAPAGAT